MNEIPGQSGHSEGEQLTSRELLERPIPALAESLGKLRRGGFGRPIGIGVTGEDGQPTADTQYIGQILPTRGGGRPNWHVIIMDNGMAAMVGQQHGGEEAYQRVYGAQEALLYPPGTSRMEAFHQLVPKPHEGWHNGAATYHSTEYSDDQKEQDSLKHNITEAINVAEQSLNNREGQRQRVATLTTELVNKAFATSEQPSST